MNCEDCKNYQPKQQPLIEQIKVLCTKQCKEKHCEECTMPFDEETHTKCPIWQLVKWDA